MWFDGVRAVKNYRQAKIEAVVEAQSSETQEELAAILREQKIDVTQATVSRDIKELHLVKVPYGRGKYRYAFPTDLQRAHSEVKMKKIFQDVVTHIESSGNLIVIKTHPGAGGTVAFALDNAHWPELIGTVAGDDTILVIVKQGVSAQDVAEHMRNMITSE